MSHELAVDHAPNLAMQARHDAHPAKPPPAIALIPLLFCRSQAHFDRLSRWAAIPGFWIFQAANASS